MHMPSLYNHDCHGLCCILIQGNRTVCLMQRLLSATRCDAPQAKRAAAKGLHCKGRTVLSTCSHTLIGIPGPADTEHRFTEREDDWGFMQFYPLSDLRDKKEQFYPDGVLHIKTSMKVELEEKYTGVTRQRTGYVGLKNQARPFDTCISHGKQQSVRNIVTLMPQRQPCRIK
jgi:hypothetical protein